MLEFLSGRAVLRRLGDLTKLNSVFNPESLPLASKDMIGTCMVIAVLITCYMPGVPSQGEYIYLEATGDCYGTGTARKGKLEPLAQMWRRLVAMIITHH